MSRKLKESDPLSVSDAQEAVTEEAIQWFYTFWRSRFLKQVLEAVQNSNNT